MNKIENFENVQKSLKRFMQNNFSTKNDYFCACQSFRVDKYLNEVQEVNLLFQKDIYEKYNNDLRKLLVDAKLFGVDVLVLKGIVLAEELFNPYILRRSLDLDILVDYKNLIIIDKLLKNLGYASINESYTNSINCVLKYPSIRKEITHITPYKKEFENGFVGYIEVHINFCHYLPHENRSLELSYFRDARERYVESGKFYVNTLSINDSFIHLCAHMYRHFYWEFFRFLRGKNHFEFRMDLLFEIMLFYTLHENEILSYHTINRIIELNQIEPVLVSVLMMDYVFDCVNLKNYTKSLRKIYDGKVFQNDLSSDFCEAILNSELSEICKKFGHELTRYIMQQLRNNKPIYYLKEGNYAFCEKLGLHLFNKNLTEVKINFDNKLKFPEEGTYSISYDADYLSLSFNIPQNDCLLGNVISTICLGVCKDEDSGFFDEYSLSNPQDKRFSKNMQTIFIKFYELGFKVTINDKEIQEKNLIEVIKVNNFEISIKLPFSLLKIKPINRRIINLVAYIEFSVDFEEAKYLRYQTKKGISDYYALYYPWPTECGRYQLI